MTVPHTADVLVVGGGATGAGVVRDLARRGLKALLVERGDYGTGTTRPLPRPPPLRRALRPEGPGRRPRVHRRRTASCGGSRRPRSRTPAGSSSRRPDDPDDYVEAFAATARRPASTCDEVAGRRRCSRASRRSTARIRRAFRVPDGSHRAVAAHRGHARRRARPRLARPLRYHRVVGFEVTGGRIVAALLAQRAVRDGRDGSRTQFVVSGGRRMGRADRRVRRRRGRDDARQGHDAHLQPADDRRGHQPLPQVRATATSWSPSTRWRSSGTTDIKVPDPDDYEITREEVARPGRRGRRSCSPTCRRMRILRAYAGVRPLYRSRRPDGEGRAITRAHAILDHADRGRRQLRLDRRRQAHDLPADGRADRRRRRGQAGHRRAVHDRRRGRSPTSRRHAHYWLGHRLAEHRGRGRRRRGPASASASSSPGRWPRRSSTRTGRARIDDLRRGTRVGMGPCQGAFCTFRVAGLIAERLDAADGDAAATATAARRARRDGGSCAHRVPPRAVQGHRGRSRMDGSSRSCS